MSPISLLNPWVLLGALGAALLIAGGSAYEGYSIASLRGQHRIDALYQQAQAVSDEEQKRAFEASKSFELGKAKGHIVYQTIRDHTEQVIHDNVIFYSGECLDADGLRSVNAAFAGKKADTTEPTAAVPATQPADGN